MAETGPPSPLPRYGNKPVQQIDVDTGAVLAEFSSGSVAAAAFRLTPNEVSDVVGYKKDSVRGYKFQFKFEEHRDQARNPTPRPVKLKDAEPEGGDGDNVEEEVAAAAVPEVEGARKRSRNSKYSGVNYSDTHIEGVDSDVDTNALKQSDSEDDKPRRKQKPRPKASDFPERRYEKMQQQHEAGGGRGRPLNNRWNCANSNGALARGGAWGSGGGPGQQQQQTVRMEPGFGDIPYTLTGGVPDWCDFEPQYEDDGSRTLEAVLGRRKIDRTKPNNGLQLASTKKDGTAAKTSKSGSVPSPAKAAAASADASDNEGSEDDDGADESEYYDVVKMRYGFEYQCKFKGRSHLHLEWLSCDDIEALSHKAKQLLHRFLKALQLRVDEGEDEAKADSAYGYGPGEVWAAGQLLAVRVVERDEPNEAMRPPPENDAEEPAQIKQAGEVDGALVASSAGGGSGAESSAAPGDAAAGAVAPHETRQLQLLPSATGAPLFEVGDCVDVARHDRPGKPTHFGGVGLVTAVQTVPVGSEGNDDDDDGEADKEGEGKGGAEEDGGQEQSLAVSSSGDNAQISSTSTSADASAPDSSSSHDGPVRFTYTVKYVVGSGTVSGIAEEVLTSQGDGGGEGDQKRERQVRDPGGNDSSSSASNSAVGRGGRGSRRGVHGDDEINKALTPLDRCSFVLERFETEPMCEPFLEPVPVDLFPDYEEIVDHPMDLGTVRHKLTVGGTKGYREEVQFIRDMRLIWLNCKKYNHRDSAIWHTADWCHKTCERLYNHWVLAFLPADRAAAVADGKAAQLRKAKTAPGAPPLRDGASLTFVYSQCKNKKRRRAAARPWEQSCRVCEDPDETGEEVLLCDRCDAQYHLGCLDPKLDALPEFAWFCPVCAAEPYAGQSAAVEELASKQVDTMALPKHTVRVTEYLVKWQGRSYGECSWETAEDVGNEAMVNSFMANLGMPLVLPEEPVVPFARMAKEFQEGFVRTVGLRTLSDPFRAPLVQAAKRVPVEQLTDAVPMPLHEPRWAVRHDAPPPLVNTLPYLLMLPYLSRDDETPMQATKAAVYAQIRLAHYLNHTPPVPKIISEEAAAAAAAAGTEAGENEGSDEVEGEGQEGNTYQGDYRGLPPAHFLLAAGPATSALVSLDRQKQKQQQLEGISSSTNDDGAVESSDGAIEEQTEEAGKAEDVDPEVAEVALILAECVEHVVRNTRPKAPGPPCRPGEYDVVCPKLPTGFHLNIYDDDGVVKVASFRATPGGGYCPAEVLGVGVGDALTRVNGRCVSTLTFGQVCEALGKLVHCFVALRFLRHGIEVELRPNMTVIHRGQPDCTTPGEPSSKYRGVFARGPLWEVAICLHPNAAMVRQHAHHLPAGTGKPKPLYLVKGVSSDEEQAALAYDHHMASIYNSLNVATWPHLGHRRMSAFELRVYAPRCLLTNFGQPRGFYEFYRDAGWEQERAAALEKRATSAAAAGGAGGSKKKKKKKTTSSDDSEYGGSSDEASSDSADSSMDDDSDDDDVDDLHDDLSPSLTLSKPQLPAPGAESKATPNGLVCELCHSTHDGSYGAGRFCGSVCRNRFNGEKACKDSNGERIGIGVNRPEATATTSADVAATTAASAMSAAGSGSPAAAASAGQANAPDAPSSSGAVLTAAQVAAGTYVSVDGDEDADVGESALAAHISRLASSKQGNNSSTSTSSSSGAASGTLGNGIGGSGNALSPHLTGSMLDLSDVPADLQPHPSLRPGKGTSAYRGVTLIKNAKGDGPDKWKAQITSSGTKFHLGMYETELEAAVQFAKAYHKLFVMAPPTSVAAAAATAATATAVVEATNGQPAAVANTSSAASESAMDEDAPTDTTSAAKTAGAAAEPVASTEVSAAAEASGGNAMEEEDEEVQDDEEDQDDDDDDEEDDDATMAAPTSSSEAVPNASTSSSSTGAAEGGSSTELTTKVPQKPRLSPEARAAKLAKKRAAERVVKEREWLEAGHAEKLLLAVLRAPFAPLDHDWDATGLEAPAPPVLPASETEDAKEAGVDDEKGDNEGEDEGGGDGSTDEIDDAKATGPRELQAGQQVAQLNSDSGKVMRLWPSGTAAAKAMKVSLALVQGACVSGEELVGFRWEPFGVPKGKEQGGDASAGAAPAGTGGASDEKSPVKAKASADEDDSSSSSSASKEIVAKPSPGAADAADAAAAPEGGEGAAVKEFKERADGVFQYHESRTYKSGNKLRDYQLAGLNWMLLCHHYKRSCILADEMGLGKTVQVVTFLEHLMSVEKKPGPFLVIVPLSTVGHWEREFASWTDMNVCMYHDAGKDMRALIRAFEWYHGGVAPRPGVAQAQNQYKFQVLITTYDEVIKDVEPLGAVPWRNLVVDEAHRLKGVTSKLLESLHQILPLGVQTFGSQHRLLMTGTPLQNNTKELWSLLNFIEPGKFPSLENFQETYEGMDSEYQVRSLQQRLAPHLLRRVKEDVATDIPAKYETVIDVELTTIQKQYYRAIFEKNLGFLARAAKGAAVPKLMNIQMELRKCCNHPYLVEGVEEREAEALQETLLQEVSEAQALVRSTGGGTRSGNNKNGANDSSSSKGAAFVSDSAFKRAWMERGVLRSSGKLVLLDKLLPKLRHEKHKVLIFSQMTRILNILEDFCEYRGFPVERLDGSITGSLRQASIDRFNEQADSFVFLLSTRAGGVGINLTAADTCIIFDSDWNPQNDVQAQARCHRIGQTKEVMVYRLITRRSFESEMFERASMKLGLERAVLGTRDFDGAGDEDDDNGGGAASGGSTTLSNGEIKLSQEEMEKLLRQGAYAMLEDDDDAEAAAFCEGDIDAILEERSRVRKIEAGTTAGWLNKKDGAGGKKGGGGLGRQLKISKASFNSSGATANADVNVDDPNFWAKVMPNMKDAGLLKDELTALLAQLADHTAATNAAAAEAENGEAGSSSAAAASAVVIGPDPVVVKKLVADIQEVAQEALDRLAAGKRLADVERRDIVDLLLRMSVSGDLVGEKARASAEGLLDAFEGKRRRNAPGASSSSGGPGQLQARIVGNGSGKDAGATGRGQGRRGRGAAGRGDDYVLGGSDEDEDDDDDDELDEEEPDEEAEVGVGSGSDGEGRRKRGRPKGSLNKKSAGQKGPKTPKTPKEKKPLKEKKPPKEKKTPKNTGGAAAALGGDEVAADGSSGGISSGRRGGRGSAKKKYADPGSEDEGTDEDDLLPAHGQAATAAKKAPGTRGGGSAKKQGKATASAADGEGGEEEGEDGGQFELSCDVCSEWFLNTDVGVTRVMAQSMSSWHCPTCAPASKKKAASGGGGGGGCGVSKKRQRKSAAAAEEEFGDEEDYDGEEEQPKPRGSNKRQKKHAEASSSSSAGGGADPAPPLPPRVRCRDWPNWPEPSGQAVRNKLCVAIIDELLEDQDFQDVFGEPVPLDAVPGYEVLCPNAMDLGTARAKAKAGAYKNMGDFRADLRLVAENCLSYNADGSEFYEMANDLVKAFHPAYLKAKDAVQ